MIFSWLRNRRRHKLLAEPFPDSWWTYLEDNVRHYRYLPPEKQVRLRDRLRVVVAEKHWVGGGHFEITEEIKVTIAAQACILILGARAEYYFDQVQTIIVHPVAYAHPPQMQQGHLIVDENVPIYGEAWHRGPIVLSWQHVLEGGRNALDGENVVFHEFAHHLDGLDGEMGGTPALADPQERQRWYRVTEAEYLRLVGSAQRHEVTLLNHYGASNKTEFFAVATECFFERPIAMRREHPELYEVLENFYQQNPAHWLPDATPAFDTSGVNVPRRSAPKRRRKKLPPLRRADEYFTRAIGLMGEKEYALAAVDLTHAVSLNPSDGEAYAQRAEANLRLGRFADALADGDEALRLEPGDADALRGRGGARVGLCDFELAVDDLTRVLRQQKDDARAFYLRGRAWAGLGDSRRSVADFSRSITLDPFDAEVYYHRGLAWEAKGGRRRAQADFERAFQLDPNVDQRA